MKKLTLDVESLAVESFIAVADAVPAHGTVEGYQLSPGCTPGCTQPPRETCYAGCTTTTTE